MPSSPLTENMGYLSLEISINGTALKDTYDLLSLEVKRSVNAIPEAVFVILLPQGEGENKTFALSETKEFIPGAKVKINLGYESKTDLLFKGMIIRHGIRGSGGERSRLVLHCQDEAVKMTVGKKVKAFEKQKDSAIIGTIIGEYGLGKDVAATNYEYAQLLQTGMTDWDFIVSRAEANGQIAYAEDGKVFVSEPLSSGEAGLKVSYDRDVFSFEAELDAGYQLPEVKSSGWDFSTGKFVEVKSSEPKTSKQGNLPGKTLAKALHVQPAAVTFTGPMELEELQGIADGMLLRSRLAALRGQVTFFGNATPKLNTLIELEGFGARFNGSALITSIRHTVREGEWRTETGFGLSPVLHHERFPQATGGHGMLPSVNGLQNAIVKQIQEDPDGENRILVTLPVLGTEIWARQTGLYATNGKGAFFLPEAGDEVIVGFLNDDPRYAVILGGVYSSKNKPPYEADEKNTFKAIVSREDLKIEINDEDKILTISTPGENSIVLSDKDKSIVLTDQNGNTVTMDAGGITLESGKDITIKAGGKLTMTGSQGVNASSDADVSVKGLNVNAEGQVGATLKGGASAELSAGGQTVVKGAMVMIN